MRSYPCNSPQAAARIVALAMLADGHGCRDELATLERLGADRQLGLRPGEFDAVVHALCDDMLSSRQLTWADACRIDPRMFAALLDEVDDPALRARVLRLCVAVVEADGHVSEAASIALNAAVEQWCLQREMLRAPAERIDA